jgi:hypothetical protein
LIQNRPRRFFRAQGRTIVSASHGLSDSRNLCPMPGV